LAELEEGAVEEVKTRVLREQLGEKLIALAALDFAAPVTARAEPEARERLERRPERRPRDDLRVTAWPKKPRETSGNERPKQKRRSKGAEHAWRAHDEGRPTKKLRRKFHGAGAEEARPHPGGKARAEALTDRKGRRVAVERYGEPPVREKTSREQLGTQSGKRGRFERASERPGKPPRKSSGRRRASDRAGGARPRHPKGRG
jgi:23S rRNA pseudouridine2605 synthase